MGSYFAWHIQTGMTFQVSYIYRHIYLHYSDKQSLDKQLCYTVIRSSINADYICDSYELALRLDQNKMTSTDQAALSNAISLLKRYLQ